jgi:hypothetical protein
MRTLTKAPFADLWTFWKAARKNDNIPDHQDLDLTQLSSSLTDISVLDIVDASTMIYRLVGSDIVNRFGSELTGLNLIDFFSPLTKDHAASSFVSVVETPCAGFATTSLTFASGLVVPTTILCLPTFSKGNNLGRVIQRTQTDPEGLIKFREPVVGIGEEYFLAEFIDLGWGTPKNFEITKRHSSSKSS